MHKIEIEKIKIAGQRDALHRAIESRIFEITNRTFEGYIKDSIFTGLSKKLETVHALCDTIDQLLDELKRIDRKST